jgi:hypothetical protein
MDSRTVDPLTGSFAPPASRRRLLGGLLPILSAAAPLARADAVVAKRKCKQPKPPALKAAFACPGPTEGEGAGTRIGQVFAATRSGTLRQIRVGVIKPPGTHGDYVVQLLAASGFPVSPDNSPQAVLAAVVLADAAVAVGSTTLVANFAGTKLVQGTAYAVVVARRGTTALVQSHLTDRCAGALIFASGPDPFTINDDADAVVSVLVA